MEAEAALVVYFYLGIALVLVSVVAIVITFAYVKKIMERTDIFVKLMIGLYEQEKQKGERIDEGGFGSGTGPRHN